MRWTTLPKGRVLCQRRVDCLRILPLADSHSLPNLLADADAVFYTLELLANNASLCDAILPFLRQALRRPPPLCFLSHVRDRAVTSVNSGVAPLRLQSKMPIVSAC